MLSRRYAAAFLLYIAVFSATLSAYPTLIRAQENQDCSPRKVYTAECGKEVKQADGSIKYGGLNCPCDETDKASGKTVKGKCTASLKCTATQTAEGQKPQTCVDAKTCPAGGTSGTEPKSDGGAGSPPGMPGGGGGGGGGDQPKPNQTPQDKINQGFKDLEPKPDLKPGEEAVSSDLTSLDEYCKQYPNSSWCAPSSDPKPQSGNSGLDTKPFTQSNSLWGQALNPAPLSSQSTGFTNTDIQPGSVLNPNITNPGAAAGLNSDITTGEFQPTGGWTEQQRLNGASTFSPTPDNGTMYNELGVRQLGPSQNDSFRVDRNDQGYVNKISAVDPNMGDQEWSDTVKYLRENSSSYCSSGQSCILVNNENNRELNILYSKTVPGGLPEGAVSITPNQNNLAASGGLWNTITGQSPTTADIAAKLQSEGVPLTFPDGTEKTMRLSAASANALAPSIANSYSAEETSFFGRAAAYTGLSGEKIADAEFSPRDRETPTTPTTPTEQPTRVYISPQEKPVETTTMTETEFAKQFPNATQPKTETSSQTRSVVPSVEENAIPQEKPQQTGAPLPAARPSEAPPRDTPTVEKPITQPGAQPTAQPSAQPSAQPTAQPSGEAPSQPSAQTSPQQSPQSQASSNASLIDRLYCLIFTCQPQQQQVQPQQQPQQPSQPVARQPQQQPQQPTAQPETQPAQQSTQQPTQQPVRTNPSTAPTPTQQPDTTQTSPSTQPASEQPTPSTIPSRNQTRLASSGTNNAFTPEWTQPTPSQAAAPSTQSGAGAAAGSNGAPSAASASRSLTNPISVSTAAAQLVARANAQAAAQSSASAAQKQVTGIKDPVLAVNKATDPTNIVPNKSATTKPDPAANNPDAGGTEGSPRVTQNDPTKVQTVEPKVAQGEKTGGQSDNPARVSTPNPTTKKPTVGDPNSGKVGTGGSGTGNGTGVGNGNGSEAGVQANSTCNIACRAKRLLNASLNAGQETIGIKPAIGAPTPNETPADAQKKIAEKLEEVKKAVDESTSLGKTAAALEPLRKALQSGREAAEIANNVSNPAIKAMAGDLNRRVNNLQDALTQWDNSNLFTMKQAGDRMQREFPTAIPAAIKTLENLNDALGKLASGGAPGKAEAPLGEPLPASRPPVSQNVQPTANPATTGQVPAQQAAPSPAQQAAAARNGLKSAAEAFNTPAYRANNWQKLRQEALRSDLVQAVYNVRDQKPITDAQQQALKPYLTGKNTFQNGTVANKAAAEAEFKNLDRYISHINDDWCAGTVAAVMNKVADGKVPNYIYVDDFYKSMKESGTLHPRGDGYQPQPMDLFFTPKGGDTGNASPLGAGYAVRDANGVLQPGKSQISGHVGFVLSYDPSTQTVTTIEGNASGEYKSLKRSLSSIMAFGDTTSYMEKTAPGSVQKQSQSAPDPKSPVVVPKNAPNIPGPYNPASGAQLINAANTVCKAIGCNAQTAARALGGVVGIESQGNAQVPHPGSPYQGYGQLGADETNRALAKLKEIAGATNLSLEERAMVNSVTGRADETIAKGLNPNADTHVGPWLLAGLHAEQGTLAKATGLTDDPRLAAAYMMNAQFAPSMMKLASYGPNVVLPPNAVAAYNKQGGLFIPMGATVAQAAEQVLRWKGERIDQGIAMIDSLASGRDYVPYTGQPVVACSYKGCATTPTFEPGKEGRSPGIQRAASCGGGLCAQSAHTGAVYTSSSLNREQFVQAAREEEAMERLAQNGKLPDGAQFKDFKAVQSNKDAVNPLTAIAKASGHPVIPGAKVESWFPMNDISKAPRRDAIISHQSGGNHGTGLNTARAQTFNGVNSLGTEWWVLADGTILHTRPETDTAHIGINKPPDAKHLLNDNTVGIEFEGQIGQKLTPQQIDAGKKLMQYLQERYNLPASEVYRHGKVGGREGAEMEQITREMNYKPGTGIPAYTVTDANGEKVADNVPLDPRSVSANGDVRLLSDQNGKPLGTDGTQLKDGTAPLLASSDATLPKATQDPQNPDTLTFNDERPDKPAERRKGFDSPHSHDWTRGGYAPTNRPTSYCIDNNGQLYGCTPTGGSNPTGGSAPTGGSVAQARYPAQQIPRQNPSLPPYVFPPSTPIPKPAVVSPLAPSLSCSPSAVPQGTSSPIVVSWSCLTGSASSTGFAAGTPVGRTTLFSSRTGTTTLNFRLQCVDGARISPTVTCSVRVVTPPAPTVSLSIDPNPVHAGSSAILIWGSSNASRCSIKTGAGTQLINGETDGSTSTPPITVPTPITLTCMNAGGITASTTITVRVR